MSSVKALLLVSLLSSSVTASPFWPRQDDGLPNNNPTSIDTALTSNTEISSTSTLTASNTSSIVSTSLDSGVVSSTFIDTASFTNSLSEPGTELIDSTAIDTTTTGSVVSSTTDTASNGSASASESTPTDAPITDSATTTADASTSITSGSFTPSITEPPSPGSTASNVASSTDPNTIFITTLQDGSTQSAEFEPTVYSDYGSLTGTTTVTTTSSGVPFPIVIGPGGVGWVPLVPLPIVVGVPPIFPPVPPVGPPSGGGGGGDGDGDGDGGDDGDDGDQDDPSSTQEPESTISSTKSSEDSTSATSTVESSTESSSASSSTAQTCGSISTVADPGPTDVTGVLDDGSRRRRRSSSLEKRDKPQIDKIGDCDLPSSVFIPEYLQFSKAMKLGSQPNGNGGNNGKIFNAIKGYYEEILTDNGDPFKFEVQTDMPSKKGGSIDHVWEKINIVDFFAAQLDNDFDCDDLKQLFFSCGDNKLQKVFDQLPSMDGKNPQTGFVGMNRFLNGMKGRLFSQSYDASQFQNLYSDPAKKIQGLQRAAMIFDMFRSDSGIQEMHNAANDRIYQVLLGLDDYISTNKIQRANGKGDLTRTFGDTFKTWYSDLLSGVGTAAYTQFSSWVDEINTLAEGDTLPECTKRAITNFQSSGLYSSDAFQIDQGHLSWSASPNNIFGTITKRQDGGQVCSLSAVSSTTVESTTTDDATSTSQTTIATETTSASETTTTSAPSATASCAQDRPEGAPSGEQLADALTKNNALNSVCGAKFDGSGDSTHQTFNHGSLEYVISRDTDTTELSDCQTAFDAIITNCIRNGNSFGGSYAANGQSYSITNAAFPNNPLIPGADDGAPPASTSTTAAPQSTTDSAIITGPTQFCMGLSPGGGDTCITIPADCSITRPVDNVVPQTHCAGDPTSTSTTAAPPPPPTTTEQPPPPPPPATTTEAPPAPPAPTETNHNNKGSALCASLKGKLDGAGHNICQLAYLNGFDDAALYTGYTSRPATQVDSAGNIVLDTVFGGLFGEVGCTAMFKCDSDEAYRVGMTGRQIKDAFDNLYANGGVKVCGSSYLSNGCGVTVNGCNDCRADG